MRLLLTVKVREYDDISRRCSAISDNLLVEEPSMYDEEYETFLNSAKTAFFMYEWMDEKDEEFLLEGYDIRPGEIKVKLDLADWLLYSAEELARILNFMPILKDISKTRYRIKYGVKEELFALLRVEGIGRIRARKLFNNGVKDVGDLKSVDIMTLSQLLGKQIAINVKKAVGENVDKIPVKENKRKGQINLMDFDEK